MEIENISVSIVFFSSAPPFSISLLPSSHLSSIVIYKFLLLGWDPGPRPSPVASDMRLKITTSVLPTRFSTWGTGRVWRFKGLSL